MCLQPKIFRDSIHNRETVYIIQMYDAFAHVCALAQSIHEKQYISWAPMDSR